MRNTWWKRGAFAAVLACSMFLAAPADATVVVQVDRAQLVGMSDLVVRATVGNAQTRWSDDHARILTYTRLTVTQYLKGTGPAELVLRQMGGEIDGLVSRIAGDAHLTPGQEVVLCLRQGDGVVFLTAMAQSAWYVTAQPGATPVASRDLSGLTFARMIDGRMTLIEPTATEGAESLPRLLQSLAAASRAASESR